MLVTKNSYLVELNFETAPNAGDRILFKDVPDLRIMKLQGLESFNSDQLATSPSGKPVITLAMMQNLLATLVMDDTDVVFQFPLYSLSPPLNGGFIREFGDLRININKSYLTPTLNGAIAAGSSAILNFHYINRYSNLPNKKRR